MDTATLRLFETIIEALSQFIDNQPEVDDPNPDDLCKVEIAQWLLDWHELALVTRLTEEPK